MPRKTEVTPVKVLEYFGNAPYDAAVLVLQLATQAVKMRAPKAPEKGKKKDPTAKDPTAANTAVDTATRSVGQGAHGSTGQAAPATPRARRQTAGASQPASPTTAASPAAGGTTTTAPAGQVDGLPGMATV
jgi:hypothetical protein